MVEYFRLCLLIRVKSREQEMVKGRGAELHKQCLLEDTNVVSHLLLKSAKLLFELDEMVA